MLLTLAWLGGALFVAALAWCAYFYAVVLGRSAGAAEHSAASAVAINVTLFSVFALHHSLLARTAIKREVARAIPPGAERTLYVWVASLLLIAVCALWQPLPGLVYAVAPPWQWLLYAVQLSGVVLTWRGAAVIDVLELAGIRQVQGDRRSAEFRVVGPFRVVRHPIYLGWLLMVFGAPTMTWSRLLFAVVSSGYLIAAIPFEERSLVEAFGERYRRYQTSVRWRLLPGVW